MAGDNDGKGIRIMIGDWGKKRNVFLLTYEETGKCGVF